MTEKKIEFNKIKEIWSELALTGFAKDEIEKATIILEESKLRKELRDTTNAKEMIEKLGNPPLQNVTELSEILEVAQRGDCLSPYQLERIEKILLIVERLKNYLSRGNNMRIRWLSMMKISTN